MGIKRSHPACTCLRNGHVGPTDSEPKSTMEMLREVAPVYAHYIAYLAVRGSGCFVLTSVRVPGQPMLEPPTEGELEERKGLRVTS